MESNKRICIVFEFREEVPLDQQLALLSEILQSQPNLIIGKVSNDPEDHLLHFAYAHDEMEANNLLIKLSNRAEIESAEIPPDRFMA